MQQLASTVACIKQSRFADFFCFSSFNALQAKCFEQLFMDSQNLVITAPTGSGKTVLLEMAILRMLDVAPSKVAVLITPYKALCTERFLNWKERFSRLGVICMPSHFYCIGAEFTGSSRCYLSMASANLMYAK